MYGSWLVDASVGVDCSYVWNGFESAVDLGERAVLIELDGKSVLKDRDLGILF